MVFSLANLLSLLLILTMLWVFGLLLINGRSVQTKLDPVVVKPRRQARGFIDFDTGRRVDINPLTKREEFVG